MQSFKNSHNCALVLLVMMALSRIYLTYLKEFSFFTVLFIGFIPLVIINVTSYKKINLEIERRK